MFMKLFIVILFNHLIMLHSNTQINENPEILVLSVTENHVFPNNPKLPVIIYKQAFYGENLNPSFIENVLHSNNWKNSWRNGIYSFHHYHSTAHEVLSVYKGWAEVQLGGNGQKIYRIEKGDVVVLPAGVAHKKINSGDGFMVIGAYPDGQQWDMNYGKKDEFKSASINISKVKIPSKDPLFGTEGTIFTYWK